MSGINPYVGYMGEESTPFAAERLLARKIKGIIDSAAVESAAFIEESSGLCFDRDFERAELEIDYERLFAEEDQDPGLSVAGTHGSSYKSTPPSSRNFVDVEYKRRAVEYWKSAKTDRRQLTSVQTKFKKVNDARQLRRWEQQLQTNGSLVDKCRALAEAVLERFLEAVENHAIVRELHIRRWALLENQEIGLEKFRASRGWAWKFLNAHRIVSRK